jgi:hypothetical protein
MGTATNPDERFLWEQPLGMLGDASGAAVPKASSFKPSYDATG